MLLQPREFRDALADPLAGETFTAAGGHPMVVVEVRDAAGAADLSGLDTTALGCVVVLLAPDPAVLAGDLEFADLLLTDDATAGRPWVAPPGGARAGLANAASVITENPVAAASLALLLRSTRGLGVAAALI